MKHTQTNSTYKTHIISAPFLLLDKWIQLIYRAENDALNEQQHCSVTLNLRQIEQPCLCWKSLPSVKETFCTVIRSLTAVGRLIRSIYTVIVPVTHPHPWDTALGDGTLELIGGTCHLRCKKKRRETLHKIRKNCNKAPTKWDYNAALKFLLMAPRDHNIYYPETYFTSLTAITLSVHSDDSNPQGCMRGFI